MTAFHLLALSTALNAVADPCGVPVVDVGALVHGGDEATQQRIIAQIGQACIEHGFLQVTNHGIPKELRQRLEAAASAYFALPATIKRDIEMAKAGTTWRGYFSVGEEVTSGVVDQKEGLYFSKEVCSHAHSHCSCDLR